jgi:hypothetical protein
LTYFPFLLIEFKIDQSIGGIPDKMFNVLTGHTTMDKPIPEILILFFNLPGSLLYDKLRDCPLMAFTVAISSDKYPKFDTGAVTYVDFAIGDGLVWDLSGTKICSNPCPSVVYHIYNILGYAVFH